MSEEPADDQLQAEWLLNLYEELLRNGRFGDVDTLLSDSDVSEIGTTGLLCVLTITYWGKDKLKARDAFLARVEPVIKARLGEGRGEKLLENRR